MMPPRKGRATYIDAVNRAVDIVESLLVVEAPIQPTTGRTYQPVQDASQSFHSPQESQQQSNCKRFRPRGKHFKKKANSSSSGYASSGSGSGSGGMSCVQCGGRHPTSQCRGAAIDPPIRSTTRFNLPPSIYTRRLDGFSTDGNSSSRWPEQVRQEAAARVIGRVGGAAVCVYMEARFPCGNHQSSTCVTLNGSGIQLAVGPQPLWLRNHNFGLAQQIMVKRLATSPHDPLGITDSACKNQLVVVSIQYGPFNTYIPIKSTTIGKSRVAIDPIAMHTSWRSNSDIASITSIGYPRMRASGESSTTKHRLLHASGPHPIPPPNVPKVFHITLQLRFTTAAIRYKYTTIANDFNTAQPNQNSTTMTRKTWPWINTTPPNLLIQVPPAVPPSAVRTCTIFKTLVSLKAQQVKSE
ncbi:hypothetical protein F511_18599 [Dorcoceras hygrometricum]|uniref:Uncharacterized protein n=1 Tax=Dorcoceras hygrometricum TaxID=472368 RepID=A0A2Z7AAA1_9LAMI|nr:hypothetical protein F511_18599 [Dorcoceras hygrometricum]